MAFKRDRGVVTAIFHVCSVLLMLQVSSTPRRLNIQKLPIEKNWWEPTFESLIKPILMMASTGLHHKEIVVWSLLSSLYAVVCAFYKSYQHFDAKIVKNFPYKCMDGNLLLNSLLNPCRSRYARGGIKKR